jgi:UDP-glucose 4-epimerase
MDFISVRDVARAYLLAAASPQSDVALNAGTGVQTSLKELCLLMCEATGSVAEPEYLPARTVNPVTRRQASTVLARETIGFESQVGLAEGLRDLLAWYRAQPVAVRSTV